MSQAPSQSAQSGGGDTKAKGKKWVVKSVTMVRRLHEWEAYFKTFLRFTPFEISGAQRCGEFDTRDKTVEYYSKLRCPESVSGAVWDLVQRDCHGLEFDRAMAMAFLISKVMVCKQRGQDPVELVPDSLPRQLSGCVSLDMAKRVPKYTYEEQ